MAIMLHVGELFFEEARITGCGNLVHAETCKPVFTPQN